MAEGHVIQGNYAVEVFDNLRDNPSFLEHNANEISFHGEPVMISDLIARAAPPRRNKTIAKKEPSKKGKESKLE